MIILLNTVWFFVSVFLILVILVQRGRGGGLAGALGGAGGSSAFGTKAGDVFTKITVGVFAVWLLLALILVPMMSTESPFEDGSEASKNPDLVSGPEDNAAPGSPDQKPAAPTGTSEPAKSDPVAPETKAAPVDPVTPEPAKAEPSDPKAETPAPKTEAETKTTTPEKAPE